MTRPEPQPARGRGPGGFGDRIRALPWLVGGAPRPVLGILGGVLVVLGLFLFLRPLTAVQTLGLYVALSCLVAGVSDLLTPRRGSDGSDTDGGSGLPPASALVWLVAGLSGLAWWSRDGDLFAPAIGVFLVVSGAVHLARFAARRSWDLLATALLGVAELLFGALAFAWHDATVVVAGVLFGGRTVAFGITLLARALGRTPQPATRRRPRVLRISLAALLLLTAAGTTALSHGLRSGGPVLDSFYATPATLPDKPGVLVRTAPYEHELPAGMRGIRIYYTTTDAQDRIVPSTGLLVVPDHPRAPMPLITWAHGTVGVARACAPSNLAGAFAPDQEPAAGEFARLGWAFVATDYPGMGAAGAFPYLIGQGEGRAVLDAARAAREVAGLTFSDKTVIWGHSQGGHGALWAGQLAAGYVPDLDVVGTAALAPASNPRALADSVLSHTARPGASLGIAFVVGAYTGYYPDVPLDEVAPPAGRTLIRAATARCTNELGTLVTILTGVAVAKDAALIDPSALHGRFGMLLDQNIPTGPWSAPLFIGQGNSDEVIDIGINRAYVAGLCARHTDVDFREYAGGTHMSILRAGSALNRDLVGWTQDRLAGRPAPSTC